jgi:hypothetical protein
MFEYRGFHFLEILFLKKIFQFLKCNVRTIMSDSHKTQKKERKENCPTLVSSTFGRPFIYEKFFTHRARNNFEPFHGIEGQTSSFSWAQEFRKSLKAIPITLYILVRTCAHLFFSVVV